MVRSNTAFTPILAVEVNAEAFLERLKDAVDNEEDGRLLVSRFTKYFARYKHNGRDEISTRNAAANLLADEAPNMIEEYTAAFEECKDSMAWCTYRPTDGPAPVVLPELSALPSIRRQGPGGSMHETNTERQSVGPMAGRTTSAEPNPARETLPARQVTYAPSLEPSYTVPITSPLDNRLFRANNGNRQVPSAAQPTTWKQWTAMMVPEGRGRYVSWFTMINTAVIVGIFAYMAGDYAMWVRQNSELFSNTGTKDEYTEILELSGDPQGYWRAWLQWNITWQTFAFDFLRIWGGRFLPELNDGAWWQWFTSIYIHQSTQHILSNLLLFLGLSIHLEMNYGWWRMLLVWIFSGVGGSLISAAFEDECVLVVGASGAVFGFMGLFVADLIVNFESISRPIVRVILIAGFATFFIANAVKDSGNASVSHLSHIGGVICGFFPSLLFLPNVRQRQLKALQRRNRVRQGNYTAEWREEFAQEAEEGLRESFWTRYFCVNPLYILGVLVVIVVYVILPIYIYNGRLDESKLAECPGYNDPDAPPSDQDARRLLMHGISNMPRIKRG